ncbi:MFS transporter [Clostridium guangxiense]|uniref:MFS transporter n=1 Tax=Clostridium guangxiense TaxID=1662055 RepID=UPI001E3E49CE|nr:MFS transporter [Clostridium guangxiense]MCD2345478.1 MFS transporter [Clostridium guangxiense]
MLLLNKSTFKSLRHRDFRCFIIGQAISVIGTWLQKTAQTWLLYTLTKSPLLLGMLGVFQFGPTLLFSAFSGAIVDRFPKKKLLYCTQITFMIQAFILFILVYTNHINYWSIFILAVISGFATTLDMPTRQSYFIELVGKEDLPNAVSLNSSIFNIAKIIGPSIAGIIMVKFGTSFCFFLNFLSFTAVLIGLFFISAKDKVQVKHNQNLLKEVKDGLVYIRNNIKLVKTFILMGIVCTFCMNIDVISPVFSKTVLHRGANGYTFLLSAMGFGSLLGTFKMASTRKKNLNFKLLKTAAFSTAIFQLLVSFSNNYYLCALFILGTGFANLAFLNGSNSILQLNTEDEYRGRVMSIYSLFNAGSVPIGNFFVGSVMNAFGGRAGFSSVGIITVILTGAFALFFQEKHNTSKSFAAH